MGWFEVGEMELISPNLVLDVIEKVRLIRERLKLDQSCQKSYSNFKKKDLEFDVFEIFIHERYNDVW